MISTRGRYALRVIVDLAEHRNGEFIPMKDVAERLQISLKYLEKIMPMLSKAKLVEGVHGKGGGYRLSREPEDLTVWEVLQVAEGDLAPVACLSREAVPCQRASFCSTLPMWQEYYELTKSFFKGKTIADLMKIRPTGDYII